MGYTIYNWCSKTNRCASQNWLPLTFQKLLGEVFCTLPYDTDGRRCCLLWRQKGWVTVEGECSLTLQWWGSWTMMARDHWQANNLRKSTKGGIQTEIPGVTGLSRRCCCQNCREWLMLLVSMEVWILKCSRSRVGREGGWKCSYWSVWTLHSSVLPMRCSFSLNTTHDLHKGHPSQHALAHFSSRHHRGRIFRCVCVNVHLLACLCPPVNVSECVCNEGWFFTPGEAREVWGWPSLAVGEKYHLHGEEVIGCLRLSFWLIVDRNS